MDDLWQTRKQRARDYLKTRQYKWLYIGKDERGRDKYLSVDTTTYHYDKENDDEMVPHLLQHDLAARASGVEHA